MRKWLSCVAATLLVGCSAAGTAHDLPNDPIVDRADILPAAEEALLNRDLHAYWEEHRTAIVVASVTSLEGRTIEQVAFEMFNSWGIGSTEGNRGLLLLVAPNERKVRIEVGCGLESVITNEFAAQVIKDRITPSFRAGDLPAGIEAGVDALAEALVNHPEAHPISPLCLADERMAA